ncbi:hypothetical protein GCM10009122_20730 [Fulvivirga kasyanovii]
MKNQKKELINDLVIKGILPIAYYNSEIIELDRDGTAIRGSKMSISKYKQSTIQRAAPDKCISKIYELF